MASGNLGSSKGIAEFNKANFLRTVTQDGYKGITREKLDDGSVAISATSGDRKMEFLFHDTVEDISQCASLVIDGEKHGKLLSIEDPIVSQLFSDAEKLGVAGKRNLIQYTENLVGEIVTTSKNHADYLLNNKSF